MVPGEGFEPSVEDPKSSALPLGHPGLSLHTTLQGARGLLRGVTFGGSVALGLVMRNAFLAALVLATAACGAYQFPGTSPAATGTVAGSVLAFPCAPVMTAGQQCAGRPVAGIEIDFTSGSGTAKALTDSTGHFTATLAAETWTVHLVTKMPIISGPQQVTVVSGSTVTATYIVDSGIRIPVPVPQQ